MRSDLIRTALRPVRSGGEKGVGTRPLKKATSRAVQREGGDFRPAYFIMVNQCRALLSDNCSTDAMWLPVAQAIGCWCNGRKMSSS